MQYLQEQGLMASAPIGCNDTGIERDLTTKSTAILVPVSYTHLDVYKRQALITDYGKDVIQLEQRMAELAAADAARTKKHHERHAAAPEH